MLQNASLCRATLRTTPSRSNCSNNARSWPMFVSLRSSDEHFEFRPIIIGLLHRCSRLSARLALALRSPLSSNPLLVYSSDGSTLTRIPCASEQTTQRLRRDLLKMPESIMRGKMKYKYHGASRRKLWLAPSSIIVNKDVCGRTFLL